MTREVMMEWLAYGNPDEAMAIANSIGAGSIILGPCYPADSDINIVRGRMEQYKRAGFKVYLYLAYRQPVYDAPPWLPPPEDPVHTKWLELDSDGIGIYLLRETDWAVVPNIDKENWVISLLDVCKTYEKSLAYFHGDGMDAVDAKRLTDAGLILWGWFWAGTDFGPPVSGETGWKASTWNVPIIWAQNDICGGSPEENIPCHRFWTADDIHTWYNKLLVYGRKPEAISWWLYLADNHKPTEEQIQAMKEVTEKYTAPISPLRWLLKIKNSLSAPVKLIKINEYNLGTLQPGDEVEITKDIETILIELREFV